MGDGKQVIVIAICVILLIIHSIVWGVVLVAIRGIEEGPLVVFTHVNPSGISLCQKLYPVDDFLG